MKPYQTLYQNGQKRLRFELIVHPDVKRVLNLEQLFTLLRQTVQPDSITRKAMEQCEADDTALFQSGGGERYYQILQGEWQKNGKTICYYMDDDMINGEDGLLSAALIWWDVEAEDMRVETLFAEFVEQIFIAQENFLLYGTMKGFA